jgi:cytosine/adenosine deaminase-related metal-dependent hydrolase
MKLVGGRYVIHDPALLPDGGIVEDGAVAIDGGKVVAVDRRERLQREYPDAEQLGTPEDVVLPGLVNSHSHGWGLTTLQMGVADDYLEAFNVNLLTATPPDVYAETLYACSKLIRSGVTAVWHAGFSRDWSEYEPGIRAALRAYGDAGIRVSFGVHVMDRSTFVYADDKAFLAGLPPDTERRVRDAMAQIDFPTVDDFRRVYAALRDEYADHERIRIALGPLGPEWCGDDLLEEVAELARRDGSPVQLHCLESSFQRAYLERLYGKPTMRHLAERGLAGPHVSLAHGTWLSDDDVGVCADSGVTVCNNPSSNLRLRVGVLPGVVLAERGVNLALGMDSTTLNDDEDMFQELRLAYLLHRLPRGMRRTPSLTPSDVLRAATVNAATPLAMDGIGRLAPGAPADVVVLDWERIASPTLPPDAAVVDVLVARARSLDVKTVLVGGDVLLRDRQLVSLDEEAAIRTLVEGAGAPPPEWLRAWRAALAEVRPYCDAFYETWPVPELVPHYTVNSKT